MGNVRTDQVKRTARELVRRFPDKFSVDFEENKRLVNQVVSGITVRIRNQIAGYITRFVAGKEAEEIPEEEVAEDQLQEQEEEGAAQ